MSFRKFSKAQSWEINLEDLTVLCNCTTKEARIACSDFKATLMQEPVHSNSREELSLQPFAMGSLLESSLLASA